MSGLNQELGGRVPGYTEEGFGQSKSSCVDRNNIITRRLTSVHT